MNKVFDESIKYDLMVVGSTPGGIAMAITAARQGLVVLLTNYHDHPGGLLSSGLAVWDTLYEGCRSPFYDEVRRSIMDYYRETYGESSQAYRESLPGKTGHTNGKFEAKIAEKTFRELILKEENITFLTPYFPQSVEKDGAVVTRVILRETNGLKNIRVKASIFADCTYEGDLVAKAGASYALGRESENQYKEPHAGRIFMQNLPTETPPIHPGIAEEISRLNIRHFGGPQKILDGPGSGEADGLVQAFNYRTMLSIDPANRILPEKPADYDMEFYSKLEFGSRVMPVPNQKIGWNRPQLVGTQTEYVEADWTGRKKVLDAHWKATLGLLYYMQNDAPLPPEQREEWRKYGLAKDEFVDNGHRPYEIYVREARRLIGRHVFTEHDGRPAEGISRTPIYADSIAATEWYFDCHACSTERVKDSMEEGKMMLHQETMPGQISWRCLLPHDLENLLVPICLSSSHVAWGGIRLEPTWMNVAESAAQAAVLARRKDCHPASLNPDEIIRSAADAGIMLTFFNDVDTALKEAWVPAVQYFGTKGFFPGYNAFPDKPLTSSVANAWKAIVQQMYAPDFNPSKAAALVALAEQEDSAPATESDLTGVIISDAKSFQISRAKACQLLYRRKVT